MDAHVLWVSSMPRPSFLLSVVSEAGARPLLEAAEPLEREAPWSATDTVAVGDDVSAEVAAAEVLVVEERHCCVGFVFSVERSS